MGPPFVQTIVVNRRLDAVLGNTQKLDGGAMFGNAPKALWSRWCPADALNRIDLSTRCLLIREANRNILLETGIGAFFSPELRARYGIQEAEHVLLQGLSHLGLAPADIDIIVLSHLHFDHAGGLLRAYEEGEPPALAFPEATVIVGKKAFQRAKNPHARDRVSFIPELPALLEASSGGLEVVETASDILGPDYRFHPSDGHTPGLMLTEVSTDEGPIVFASDLIPGRPWVRTAITMGYDRFPELLIDEKAALLEDLYRRNGRLFFTHDPGCAVCHLSKDEAGRINVKNSSAELSS
jgi:glyoxylase-like metal-dependent hydrolase (beta-lactamase superfamily II)